MKKFVIALTLLFAALGAFAQSHQLDINLKKPGAAIQPTQWGIFFEDINYAADGGLYAELVKNRSFEFPCDALQGWKAFGAVQVRDDGPFPRNPHYVRLSDPGHPHKWTGLDNEGYFGIGIKKGENYRFSVWARVPDGGESELRVELVNTASMGEDHFLCQEKLTVSGSAGYGALKEYMEGSEITEEYGKDPVWSVDKMDKGNERIIYSVTVNGHELDVTTVSINGKWFVLGIQTETANSLASALEKIISDRTMYISIADLDRDKKVEIIEFSIGEDSATLCSVYSLDDASLIGSFEINCGSPGSTGKWQLYHDISGADRMIIEYSRYSAFITEKNIAAIDTNNEKISLNIMFSEQYTTQSVFDEEGNETKQYFTNFYYNGRQISPADYFENQTDFNSRYTPATVDTLYTYRWQKAGDIEEDALIAAVTLVEHGWN